MRSYHHHSVLYWFAVAFLFAAVPSSAKIIYVKPSGLDAADGLTWATAKRTIQAGIDTSAAGNEIWVAAGPAYVERITLKSGVGLYGGFNGTETSRGARNPNINVTIIDGNAAGHVVSASGAGITTTIDGFTIRNGSGTGAGIYCYNASPAIASNIVTGNAGSGIYCYAAAPVITGNIVQANSGRGIDCRGSTTTTISNNIIRQNLDGGIYCDNSAPTITRNTVERNSTSGDGGGINTYYSSPVIQGNTIYGNFAQRSGGGIMCYRSSPVVKSNVISWNTAADGGGLLLYYRCEPTIANNTIIYNSATLRTHGGAISLENASTTVSYPTVANNVIADNSSGIYRVDTSTTPTLANNCLWDNTHFAYSGVAAGVTDFQADPQIASDALGDYHLSASSPCLNAGSDTYVSVGAVDCDNEARISGSHVDVGADEYNSGRPVSGGRRILYVKPDGLDAATGLNWALAKKTITAALAAALPGDVIWVAAGTYSVAPINLAPGVMLMGGFKGTETDASQRNPAANATILDGGNASRVVRALRVGTTTGLDGFDVKNGSWSSGAGINCDTSSPMITNCTVEGSNGTGIATYNSSPTISGCTIRNNTGRGVYCENSLAILSHCVVTANSTSGDGGGINLYYSDAIVTASDVTGNNCVGNGGGIYCFHSNARIEANNIRQNSASSAGSAGGGIYGERSDFLVISNIIAQNTAAKGAGIKIYNSANARIVNDTIVFNTSASASQAGGIEIEYNSSPSVANNIISFNVGHGVALIGATGVPQPAANCVFSNSGNAYDGMPGGPGDYATDPLLRDPSNGDYRVRNTSPCVNAGNDLFLIPDAVDIDRQKRLYGTHVDIGAGEVTPFGMVDFNGDGRWDVVAQNLTTGQISVLLMNGTNFTNSYSLSPMLPSGWLIGGSGDFVGDGTTSLAVQNLSTQQISILTISGNRITSSIATRPSMLPKWQIRCTGDFDGDGRPDLVAQNTDTREISILTVKGAYITSSTPVKPTLPAGWTVMGSGDFDGNGTSDLVVLNGATQQVSVLYMKGTTITASKSITPNLMAGWTIVGVTDANQDARPDILVQNLSTRQISVLYVDNGRFVGSSPMSPALLPGWQVVAPR